MTALVFRETGEPKSVLQIAELSTPQLVPGEALVRMLLSPIHPSDLHMLRGRYGYQPELPASPGIEGLGIVEAVGPGWWLPRWVRSQPLAEMRAATSDLLTMFSNGALTPPPIARYPWKDFQEAVRLADGESGQEKFLLDFS